MLQNRQPIIYGNGEQKRCFSYIDDDLFCLKEMAIKENVVGEIINIDPDESYNNKSTCRKNFKSSNLIIIKHTLGRPQEVLEAACSTGTKKIFKL